MPARPGRPPTSDRGTILPIVLVVSISLAFVVIALARFVTTDLSFSRVTRDRAERQASAISAITYGVERLKLGQTLCGAAVPSFGPIAPGLLDLNDTTTSLTCQRVGGTATDITGWAAIITGEGITNALRASGGDVKPISGPVYLDDAAEVDISGGAVEIANGDLWSRESCTATPPGGVEFAAPLTNGMMCTSTPWWLLFNPPVIPPAPTTLITGPDVGGDGTCRVFSPGLYTSPPPVAGAPNVYFRPGAYWFDFTLPARLEFDDNQVVWFGRPSDLASPTNAPCADEAALDVGDPGAVVYLDGDSIIRLASNGTYVEFFPRSVSGQLVSMHQVPTSAILADDDPPDNDEAFFEVRPGSRPEAVVRGLVLAPLGEFRIGNAVNSRVAVLGGLVVGRLWVDAAISAQLTISSSTSPASSKIELTATSTDAGGETVVRAIVDYRPDAALPADRVAVNSLRVVG